MVRHFMISFRLWTCGLPFWLPIKIMLGSTLKIPLFVPPQPTGISEVIAQHQKVFMLPSQSKEQLGWKTFTLDWCFSNLNVHTNHLEIFAVSDFLGLKRASEPAFLTSSQVMSLMPVLLAHRPHFKDQDIEFCINSLKDVLGRSHITNYKLHYWP